MRRPPVLHPFFLAAVPVLFLFAHNTRKLYVSPAELVLPLAVAVGFALLAWLALRFAFRSSAKAGLVVSLFLLLFFLYGHVAGALHGAAKWFRDWQLLALFLVILTAGGVLIVRSRREFRGLTVFLDIATGILLVLNLASSLPALARGGAARGEQGSARGGEPDIYHIILDGHARTDILRELYGYDNTWFLDSLRARGFYVAEQARTNYGQTYLSLGSTLNMEYVDSLADAVGRDSEDRGPLVRWLLDNRVMREFRRHGYRVVGFASGYSGTEFADADVYLAPRWAPSEFMNVLIGTTPVGALLGMFTRKSQFDLHRERVEFVLDHLPDASRVPGPVFVFAHLMPPHPPFVFGARGEGLDVGGHYNLSDGNHYHHGEADLVRQYVESYRHQVQFIDRRILRAVDEIVARSERPPVIVLQSDHGPGSRLNHDDPRWTYFPERQSILYAVLMPDRDYTGWYPSITPVNTFRLVLDRLLGDTLTLLPDHSYFASWDLPYQYVDVDTWHAPETRVPARVAIVAFRQATTPPDQADLFYRRLVSRKLPGAAVGPVFLYLVDSLPTLDEAVARYRVAVAAGDVPDFGGSFEYFQGNHGSDWAKVLALLFPLADAGRVSVVAFRFADVQPRDPPAYVRALVDRKFPGAAIGKTFVGPADEMTLDEAVEAYRVAVADGSLPDLGDRWQGFAGTGPDGVGVAVLLFPGGE